MQEGEVSLGRRAAQAAAWGGCGLIFSAAAAAGFANHASADTVIGAHEATISPTLDGYATVAGQFRYPLDEPFNLGVNIKIRENGGGDLKTALQSDALIAASPDGELDHLSDVSKDLLLKVVGEGLALGTLATAGLFIASRRRHEHLAREDHKPLIGALTAGLGIGVMITQLANPGNLENHSDATWVRLSYQVKALQDIDDNRLDKVEIKQGPIGDTLAEAANSYIGGYKDAKLFYSKVKDQVEIIAPLLRQPLEGQVVMLQVSDRHDNILMDPVAKAIGDAAGATIVADTGDDTSSGSPMEAFSLNSLNATFKDYERVVAVGNHDNGTFVSDHLKKLGWTVLAGKPKTVGGITFLGDSDPRSSTVTVNIAAGKETLASQGERLAKVACAAGNVSTLLVHSQTTGEIAAQKGCVDLELAGHLHVQVGPNVVTAENGKEVTVYTNGTTGGAAFAFALGSKLRRDAEVTLVTYQDGKPIGLQPVMIRTTGKIEPQAFKPLPGYGEPTGPLLEAKK